MTSVRDLPPEATLPSSLRFPAAVSAQAAAAEKPDAPRAALSRMLEAWWLPDLLMGGTAAMQEAARQDTNGDVLIREQDETNDEFERRVKRTVLTNYYADTIARHSGLPFAQQIVFEPELPETLKYLESNADGSSRSISVLAREVLKVGMNRGLTHVLVDIPKGAGETYADQLSRRALIHHIEPQDLLGVEGEAAKDGGEQVTYARFRQKRVEREGSFGEKTRDLVMVIETDGKTSGEVGTYEKQSDGGWLLDGPSPYRRATVPLFTFYSDQCGDFEAKPAYRHLAELNLAHYQSDADQRHGLSYGRRATLVQTGWKSNATTAQAVARGDVPHTPAKQTLGYGRRVYNDNDGAKAYFLETSGAPLEAGRNDLEMLEARMERFGAAQVSKDGGITATSRKLDNQRDSCNLEAWCTRLESVVLQAVRAVAQWMGVQLPADQKVVIDRSFADETPDSEDVPHIVQMARDKTLPLEVAYAELKLRGTLKSVKEPADVVSTLIEETERTGALEMDRMVAVAKATRPAPGGPPRDAPAREAA